MDKIFLYNTMSRKKEEFIPIDSSEVKIYSCGPTVYKNASIGNMRTNIFQDILRRVLRYNGYNIKHVMNITDVGHIVSDADTGEDKMVKSAKEENKSPEQIAEYYTDLFFKDLKELNIEKPEIVCKATDHIKEMIAFVEKLVKNGYAYQTSNTIYFDTSKLDAYGVLSNIKVDEQIAGARIDFDTEKRNPQDFALWIKAPENHLMKWDSPWGLSYPGWHIECSAMSKKYLGDQFDIHTGGIDLVPTHHENEIAQNKGVCGKIPANYWLHGEYLLINNGKMSKSLNNVYLLKDIIEKGYDPLVYKLFTYSAHYRNKLNFTWEGIESTAKSLERLKNGFKAHENGKDDIDELEIEIYESKFLNAINDDLNMPLVMSVVWDVIRNDKKSNKLANLLLKFDEILGLNIDKDIIKKEEDIPQDILNLVEERKQARLNKEWEKSDLLRDEIKNKGYEIKDSKDGMQVSKI